MIGAAGRLHGVQTLAPVVLADPSMHISQTVAPFAPEKYPALHDRHTPGADAESVAEYVPLLQLVGCGDPYRQYDPFVQAVLAEVPPTQKYPASHVVH